MGNPQPIRYKRKSKTYLTRQNLQKKRRNTRLNSKSGKRSFSALVSSARTKNAKLLSSRRFKDFGVNALKVSTAGLLTAFSISCNKFRKILVPAYSGLGKLGVILFGSLLELWKYSHLLLFLLPVLLISFLGYQAISGEDISEEVQSPLMSSSYVVETVADEESNLGIEGVELHKVSQHPAPGEPREVIHVVEPGDSLGSILDKYGVKFTYAQTFQKELTELSKSKNKFSIFPSQILNLILEDEGEKVTAEIENSQGSVYSVTISGGEVVSSKLREAPKFSRPVVGRGEIKTSFFQAAKELGVSLEIIDELVDLFSNKVNFGRDVRVGDTFSIIYREQVLESGERVAVGPLLAAKLNFSGKELIAIRYVGKDGKGRYFNQHGEYLGSAFLRYPLKFTRISSSFSKSRFHPVLKVRRPHNGVDFAAPTGTPVRAVADGRITLSGYAGAGGNTVKISHSKRYSTAYLHLSKIAKGLKKGDVVSRGQIIGAVGATGRATGAHLHYSFYDNGRYVDPMKVDLPNIDALSPENKIEKKYLSAALGSLKRYENLKLESILPKS